MGPEARDGCSNEKSKTKVGCTVGEEMMEHYNKIDTLYKRGKDFKVKIGDYTRPEFELLSMWSVTEKVDGTSTLIHFERGHGYEIGGRTANADLPKTVLESLADVGHRANEAAERVMEEFKLDTLTVYGESYGPKINGGGNYSDQVEFRAFDIRANDLWLSPEQFRESAAELGIPTVPDLGVTDIDDIVYRVRSGFDSDFAIRPVKAEGIIAKSPTELTNNAGKRLMWKLKHRDF